MKARHQFVPSFPLFSSLHRGYSGVTSSHCQANGAAPSDSQCKQLGISNNLIKLWGDKLSIIMKQAL